MTDQVVIKIGANATGAIAAFGAVAGAASAMALRILGFVTSAVTQIPRSVYNGIKEADKIYAQSKIAGVNVKDFSALAYAAKQSEVSIADLESAAKFLAKTHGVALVPALLQTALEFESMTDEVQKLTIAQERFGKGGTGLMPLLSMSQKELRAVLKEADLLGVAIGEDFAKASDKFMDSWDKFSNSLKGFAMDTGNIVLPVLQKLVDTLNEAAAAMRAIKSQTPESLLSTIWDIAKAGFKPGIRTPSLAGFAESVASGVGPVLAGRLAGSELARLISSLGGTESGGSTPPQFKRSRKAAAIEIPELRAESSFTSRGFLSAGEAQLVSRTAAWQRNVQNTLAEMLGVQKMYLPKMAEGLS